MPIYQTAMKRRDRDVFRQVQVTFRVISPGAVRGAVSQVRNSFDRSITDRTPVLAGYRDSPLQDEPIGFFLVRAFFQIHIRPERKCLVIDVLEPADRHKPLVRVHHMDHHVLRRRPLRGPQLLKLASSEHQA